MHSTSLIIPGAGALGHPVTRPRVNKAYRAAAPATGVSQLAAYSQAAFYRAVDEGWDFRLNRLTGRGQTLSDKVGWLVNVMA